MIEDQYRQILEDDNDPLRNCPMCGSKILYLDETFPHCYTCAEIVKKVKQTYE